MAIVGYSANQAERLYFLALDCQGIHIRRNRISINRVSGDTTGVDTLLESSLTTKASVLSHSSINTQVLMIQKYLSSREALV